MLCYNQLYGKPIIAVHQNDAFANGYLSFVAKAK